MEWLGTLSIDHLGRIERSIDLPETTYQHIEKAVARGLIEGIIFLDDGRRVDWFLDRGLPTSGPAPGAGFAGGGEGI
jgi:hypothetical protein